MADHDAPHDLPIDAWTLESLLDGGVTSDPQAPGVLELGALISAARGPATPAELSGEEAARAAFVGSAAGSIARSATPRRFAVLSTMLGSKIALAAAASALTLGGASAAAFTGHLPGPVQDAAHQLLGAPATDDQG